MKPKQKRTSFEAIYGSMVNTNVGEMIRTLVLFRETGALSVAFEGKSRSLFFRGGKLVYAHTNIENETLVARARHEGMIDEGLAKSMRRIHRSMGITYEAMLVSKGLLKSKELIPWQRDFIANLTTDLIGWNVGTYRFIFGIHPPSKCIPVQVDIEPLLLAGIGRVKDEDLIRRWMGPLTAVLSLNMKNPAFAKLKLGAMEGYILSRVDGNTNLRQLSSMVQQDKAKTFNFIYAAFLANLVVLDDDSLATRDYTFDLDVEREANFRTVRAADLRKDEFDLRPGDVSEDDDPPPLLTGNEDPKHEMELDAKLKVSDIAELEDEMKDRLFKTQNLPLTEKGLELRYQIWQAQQAEKDKNRMKNAANMRTSSGTLLIGDHAMSVAARKIQQLKKDISRMLKTMSGGTYYELLGVEQNANAKVIELKYRTNRDYFDPAKHSASELGIYHTMLQQISMGLDTAYSTLMDPAKRKEYDHNLDELRAKLAEAQTRKRAMADEKFNLGNEQLAKQDIMRALDFFRSAISLYADEPAYHERMALTLARRKNWVRDAMRILRNAIELEPGNARYHIVMGNICKLHGETIAAVRAYRRAAKLDPMNAKLMEEIRALVVADPGLNKA